MNRNNSCEEFCLIKYWRKKGTLNGGNGRSWDSIFDMKYLHFQYEGNVRESSQTQNVF